MTSTFTALPLWSLQTRTVMPTFRSTLDDEDIVLVSEEPLPVWTEEDLKE